MFYNMLCYFANIGIYTFFVKNNATMKNDNFTVLGVFDFLFTQMLNFSYGPIIIVF